MSSIGNIRKQLKQGGISFRSEGIEKELCDVAQRVCEDAAEHKRTGNPTGNQKDAYAWVLCHNGQKIASGFAGDKTATQKADQRKYPDEDIYGRTEAQQWIDSFDPPSKKGYVLAVSNAIFYTLIHEAKGIPVFTDFTGPLDELQHKYNGKLELVKSNRK